MSFCALMWPRDSLNNPKNGKSSYSILNVVICKWYVNSYLDGKVAMGLLKSEVAWDSLVKIL